VVKSVLSALLVVIHSILPLAAQQADVSLRAKIPKAWETQGIATLELPPPIPGLRRIQASPDQYYKLPVQPVWKSYPVYRPDKEPPGYLEWLKQQEPVPAFNPDELHTEAEWIRVGEIMFDSPLANNGRIEQVRDPTWYVQTGQPIAKDGTVPFYRYVVVKKGEVAVGRLACAMCHTRVMADGTVIKGAQGNFPFDRAQALTYAISLPRCKPTAWRIACSACLGSNRTQPQRSRSSPSKTWPLSTTISRPGHWRARELHFGRRRRCRI